MNSHLNHAIIHHNPIDTIQHEITEASANNYSINLHGYQGLTPLQYACRQGMLHVAILLLNAGAHIYDKGGIDKTPLYLAVEYDHPLLVQLLIVYGADPKKALELAKELKQPHIEERLRNTKINPDIVHALFFRFLIPSEKEEKAHASLKSNIEKLYPQLKFNDEVGGFIEFATHHETPLISKKLLKIGQPRAHPSVRTASYWLALQKTTSWEPTVLAKIPKLSTATAKLDKMSQVYAELLEPVSKNDDDKFIMLVQLYIDKKDKEFATYFPVASKAIQKRFNELNEDELTGIEEKLSPAANKIYLSAARAQTANTELLSSDLPDYVEAVIHAYHVKNYVALKLLFSVKTHPNLFAEFLKKEKYDLALFWMLYTEADLFELALSLRKDEENLATFIDYFWSTEGLLHCLLSQGIFKDKMLTAEVLELFNNIPKDSSQVVRVLAKCIENYYHLSLDGIELQQESGKSILTLPDNLAEDQRSEIAPLFQRFAFIIQPREVVDQNVFNEAVLPDPLLRIMISYLGKEDQQEISRLSPHYSDLVLFVGYTYGPKLYQLQQQINKLEAFNAQVTREFEAITGWAEKLGGFLQEKDGKWVRGSAVASFVSTVIGGSFLGVSFSDYFRLDDLISSMCDLKYRYWHEKCGYDTPGSGQCRTWCLDYDTAYDRYAGGIAGVVLGGITLAYSACSVISYIHQTRELNKRQRFATTPTADFSSELVTAATELFTEFKGTKDNPLREMSIAIPLGTLLDACDTIIKVKQKEFENLASEIKNDEIASKYENQLTYVAERGSTSVPMQKSQAVSNPELESKRQSISNSGQEIKLQRSIDIPDDDDEDLSFSAASPTRTGLSLFSASVSRNDIANPSLGSVNGDDMTTPLLNGFKKQNSSSKRNR